MIEGPRVLSKDRLRELILSRIRAGRYKPGEKITSIQKLANEAGVSCLTVSQATRELALAGYLIPVPGKGCFVNQRLPEQAIKGQDIGVLLSTSTAQETGSFPPAVTSIQNAVVKAGFGVIVQQGLRMIWKQGPLMLEPPNLHTLNLRGFVTIGIYDMRYLGRLADQGFPGVAVDVDASELGIDSVFPDHLLSAMQLVRYLANRGARRIAFHGGPFKFRREQERVYYDPCAQHRYDGYRAGLEAAGLAHSRELEFITYRRAVDYLKEGIPALFRSLSKIDGIISEFPEFLADNLSQLGVQPGSIPIVGWGEGVPANAAARGISAMATCDFGLMGQKAADLILEQLEDDRPLAPVQRIAWPCHILECRA